ncbi:MAG: hypothetical protein EBT72_05235 [Flavobacteriia bacterium]|jgi:hypothetical protein|nr:hypothetical protein [Flavobacteriia bacterium]
MKKLMIALIFVFTTTLNAQVSSFMYVKVAPENQAEFERIEMTYWSQIAKKAIDEGKMQAWGMMRKVGMAGSEANYLFVNIFKDFEQAANSNSIWDASVIGMNNSDIQTTSMREMIGLHYYQIEGAIQGAGKYSVHNYARPANLEGFVTENLKLWKPFFEKNMKAKKTKQTNWGIGTRIYPAGSESGATVFTRDGYENLADAMESLRYQPSGNSIYTSVLNKSKMSEYAPDGFTHRVIYESLMWQN